jgi:hypothetical protein
MFASCVLVAVIARDLFFAAKKSGGGKESETAHFLQMRGDFASGWSVAQQVQAGCAVPLAGDRIRGS